MNKVLEYRIQSLISLRNTYINILAILVGGEVGLLFLPNSILKIVIVTMGIFAILLLSAIIYKCIVSLEVFFDKIKD